MKRKLLLLCVATLLALAATGQTPVRQKPPRGRWGAEVNQELLPFFFMGTISADGIYNYAVADWFIIGAGVGLLLSDMEYGNDVSLVYGRAFVRLRFEVPKWKVSPVFFTTSGWESGSPHRTTTIFSDPREIPSSVYAGDCGTMTG